jgi:hypothetical protein
LVSKRFGVWPKHNLFDDSLEVWRIMTMCRKLSYLICCALVLAWGGASVALGEVWEGKITDDNDDVEQQGSSMYMDSSDLELMGDGNTHVGLRFASVFVPPGASISKAYIEFQVDTVEGNIVREMIIYGHLTPNAPAFTSAANDVSGRPWTTATVRWSPEHYPTVGQRHQTSDISPIIKEIVGQAGWVSGNALVLIIIDDPDLPGQGEREVEAGPGDDAVLLHIEYTLGPATGPNPADTEEEVSRDADLSWTPGIFAAATNGHKVYLSKKLSDVSAGIGGITQSATTYNPGRLEFGTTYYWRVDENNAPPKGGVNTGSVWSFTTELYSYPIENIIATASSVGDAAFGPENTIDGSGLDPNTDLHSTLAEDMWLSGMEPAGAWIHYEFDKPYKLHEMWVWNSNQVFESLFGFGLKNVTVEYSTDGATWTALAGVPPFTKASGAAGYAHDTTVGFGGAAAKYVKLSASSNWGGLLPQYSLSEVRFLYVPVNPTTPSPDSGATNVGVVGAALSWRAGREAATHNVSFSADEQAVIGGTAPVASVTTASYSPPALNLNTSYYWKVAEVNEAETPSTWESNVWSFTTSDFIVVEDFESYTDFSPNEIYTTWPDGYSDPLNGSQVGNLNPPFAEQTIVHGGKQSMPFSYTNTAGATYSEGKRTFVAPQNWTQHGVKALVIWFRGTAGNTGQMYVKINNTKIPYSGAAGNTALPGWQQWTIDLTVPGLSLQSVNSLAIGVDGNAAAGTLYFDDIRLYAVAPAPLVEATIIAELDDVEERIGPNNGAMDTGSSDLEMPYEDAGKVDPQIIGLRFVGIAIPKGATITNAWVQFAVDETRDGTLAANLVIDGELSPSPAAFTSTAGNVSSRTRTTAKVQWSVPNWTAVGDRGPDQRTPNIAPIIQELVNQNGWAGAAMVLMLRDNPANPSVGSRAAGRGSSILLHIEYQ